MYNNKENIDPLNDNKENNNQFKGPPKFITTKKVDNNKVDLSCVNYFSNNMFDYIKYFSIDNINKINSIFRIDNRIFDKNELNEKFMFEQDKININEIKKLLFLRSSLIFSKINYSYYYSSNEMSNEQYINLYLFINENILIIKTFIKNIYNMNIDINVQLDYNIKDIKQCSRYGIFINYLDDYGKQIGHITLHQTFSVCNLFNNKHHIKDDNNKNYNCKFKINYDNNNNIMGFNVARKCYNNFIIIKLLTIINLIILLFNVQKKNIENYNINEDDIKLLNYE
jgi:hypothetical protein